MPLEIVLVRHGQSEGNRDRVFTGHGPSALTDLGRKQAEAAAAAIWTRTQKQAARDLERLRSDGKSASAPAAIDAIYSSDLPRARSTAEPLGRVSGIPIIDDVALRERDVGVLTNLTFEEVQAQHPGTWDKLIARDAAYAPPGGESHRDCALRMSRFLDDLCARHASGRVVCFSHGVAINHLLRHVVGCDPASAPRFFFQVENCSIHRVQRLDDGIFRILATNDTAHLAAGDLHSHG